MGQTPSKILPETSGWDAEANEHPRIKWLYRILMGLGALMGIALGVGAYLYFTPKIITGTFGNGDKYEYGVQRYEVWRYKNEIFSGKETRWNTAGQMILRRSWKKNQFHGVEEAWYKSGQLRRRCFWTYDKKNGLDKYWHPNDKLAYEANWLDDELQGDPGQWDETGVAIPQPETISLDLGSGIGMELVLIPAGEFMMGANDGNNCEKPIHKVIISKPFYMGKYEVTQEQYEKVMGTNQSKSKGAKKPVEMVSWDDAQEFCKHLSQKSGYTILLPTEAQWEYACCAGTTTKWHSGDEEYLLDDYAWYDWGGVRYGTYPAGQKRPNSFGLYDMHGNVLEWCSDWGSDTYYSESPSVDPTGPDTGSSRVFRWGRWSSGAAQCRSACRYWCGPDGRYNGVGFRIVAVRRDE
ncbi:MAG: SUMF1/EgtB/PvdO family nonheme iron enzyme [Planctomycetota bacterium]